MTHLTFEPWIRLYKITMKYVIATRDSGKCSIDNARAIEMAPRIPPQQSRSISDHLKAYLRLL